MAEEKPEPSSQSQPSPKTLLIITLVLLAVGLLLYLAFRGDRATTNDQSAATTDSAPPAVLQQLVFSYPQFTRLIFLHIPPDDFASAQTLAAQNGPLEWWTYLKSQVGCIQSGYATTAGFSAVPTVDRYNLNGNQLANNLEQSGLRTIQSYTLNLNPTPWGSIQRSFACKVNTAKMATLAQGQNFHGELAIPIGQRMCQRWTYVNQYQTATPGQGPVKVFAGTFSYAMKPLVDGVQYPGQGTASVKMVLNPDTGQWTLLDFQLQDPPISISNLLSPQDRLPAQDSCPGP